MNIPTPHGRLRSTWTLWLLGALWMATPSGLLAWGPHGAITRAALNAVYTNDPSVLSREAMSFLLTNHCWMADYKRLPYKDGDTFIYADDYLLFPGMPTHPSHICPEVRNTFLPFFQRARQALLMESPANAARWLGSLLHFVEDTGSPPHAAEISGGLHAKMENWVNASLIAIPNYQPQRFGESDNAAERGFLGRMEGLIAFSRERGLKLKTPVLIGNRGAVEPVVLECALETTRVTADLLSTLAYLTASSPHDPALGSLAGLVKSDPLPELSRIPARIMILGTNVATLTDDQGRFTLRNLRPGDYTMMITRPSCGMLTRQITIEPGLTNYLEVALKDPDQNLLRNGTFTSRWLDPELPDFWYRTDLGWEGEIVPLEIGRRYRLVAKFKLEAERGAEILIRWSRRVPWETAFTSALPKIQSRPLRPNEPFLEFEGTEAMALVQVTLKTPPGLRPQETCDSIQLIPLPESD